MQSEKIYTVEFTDSEINELSGLLMKFLVSFEGTENLRENDIFMKTANWNHKINKIITPDMELTVEDYIINIEG